MQCHECQTKRIDERVRYCGQWYQQFTCFTVYDCKLKFVSQFQYLGHIINDNVKDGDNIRREIKKLFINTNIQL